jgi:circadian clock protein KaiB
MTTYQLTLYIVEGTEVGRRAVANLRALVRDRLGSDVEFDVRDVVGSLADARADRVIATPVLIRRRPAPVLKVIGDLSDPSKVLDGLGLIAPSGAPLASEEDNERVQ